MIQKLYIMGPEWRFDILQTILYKIMNKILPCSKPVQYATINKFSTSERVFRNETRKSRNWWTRLF